MTMLLVSSPSPSLAAGHPFIPSQHQAAVLPVSVPKLTAGAATPMGISRTRFRDVVGEKPSHPHKHCLLGDFHLLHPFPSFL